MKKFILIILFHSFVFSQTDTAFYNHNGSTIKMYEGAEIGFHTHLVNDGTFDANNLGFVGFYNDDEILTVSGNNRAVFNDVEINVINNLVLRTSMGVTNDLEFTEGKVITPRDTITTSLDFINYNIYAGEDDLHHVDGYASITGNQAFSFPIGDGDGINSRHRPMSITARSENSTFDGAYFYENPDVPTTFSTFDTTVKQFEVETVSTYEFWDLNGTTETSVTLTWDTLSNINLISPDINSLIVVGWNVSQNRWESLGNIRMTGDFDTGTITSIPFIPNQYEIITLGTLGEIHNNYNISPNGDGYGDTLVIAELEEYPVSKIVIFNRWGNVVYSRENYENDFNGISEGRATLNKDNELPVGTYFYELHYGKTQLDKFKNGWVYINR